MNDPKSRREKILALEAMIASWAYREVLLPEIQRLISEGNREACNLDLTPAKRDGGAGAKLALEAIRDYPAAQIRFLEAAAKRENKKATSPKSPRKPLR